MILLHCNKMELVPLNLAHLLHSKFSLACHKLRGLKDALVKIFLLQLSESRNRLLKSTLGICLERILSSLKFSDVCSMNIFNQPMNGSVTGLVYACNRFV